ncbi:GT-D fold domain-containing glycosyltransferase [Isoptericola sp. NPDC057559]|uniref:GT-D fold domain-containing glycosyltransferase n=1 Tax=Isoptericola sp. NPDC057559 TaxID=3346168 RepID=UPI00369F0517
MVTDLRRSATAAEKQVEVARQTKRAADRLGGAVAQSSRAADKASDRTFKQLQAVTRALKEQAALLEKLRSETAQQGEELRAIRVAMTAARMKVVHAYVAEHQMSYRETLTELAERDVSFARFGDGELRLMVDPLYRLGFQVNSPELGTALRATLGEQRQTLLIGWPRAFWTAHNTSMWSVIWDEVEPLLPAGYRFGNSHVSRPDCFQELGLEAVELWRKVWDGKHVAIVTGRGSRFDLIPELFDNLAGHEFVYSEPRNAFSDLDRLTDEVLGRADVDLCLVSLGPAGTILTDRLATGGLRTIDVGHISSSYANVFEGKPHPEHLPPVQVPAPDVFRS